jgi:hypothetical protein
MRWIRLTLNCRTETAHIDQKKHKKKTRLHMAKCKQIAKYIHQGIKTNEHKALLLEELEQWTRRGGRGGGGICPRKRET